jgi:hypothetical protein
VKKIACPRRLLTALALTTAGALAGTVILASQTQTLPFHDPCWDSVTSKDLQDLLGTTEAESSEILPVQSGDVALNGRCRITSEGPNSHDQQVTIRVHQLNDGLREDTLRWSEDFLTSRMTPLGNGILGLASDTRAWVALPRKCTTPGDLSGPGIVDVSFSEDEKGYTDDEGEATRVRKGLARTAVHVANNTVKELGCSGSLREPGTSADMPDFKKTYSSRNLCHVKGLRLPREYSTSRAYIRTSPGKNRPVRTCEILESEYALLPSLRLQTIEHQDLDGAFSNAVLDSGLFIKTNRKSSVAGTYTPTQAALRAECSKRTFLFIAQEHRSTSNYKSIRQTFPAYVTAEARRLGCGNIEIDLPD